MDATTLVIMKNDIKKLSKRVDDQFDLIKYYHYALIELERRTRDLEKTNETTCHDHK